MTDYLLEWFNKTPNIINLKKPVMRITGFLTN